ncbi:MAG: hypothetical protein OXT49_04705 [Gammaproteobacteria bacterium]|nr:hypothetical protein [Gammaproteobacteria bacterium]
MSAEKRLEALRAALLETEQRELEAIKSDLDKLRAELDEIRPTPEHLAPLMAPALDLAQGAQREEMAEALNAVVAEGVKKSVHADRESFAEALSPAIGISIRKAIAGALKGFNQAINQAVEYSLSPKGLRWRLEAARTGVPFAQLVMRNTLPYALEEIFLIHNETGLLAAHATSGEGSKVDSDAVSAMLTAIQDFVRDSFSVGDGQLEEVEIGGRVVWVISGAQLSFAVVVHGTPPITLRQDLEQLLIDMHAEFNEQVAGFDGDREPMAPLLEKMQLVVADSLSQARDDASSGDEEGQGKKKPWLGILVLLLVAASLGWFGWQKWQVGQAFEQARLNLIERDDVVLLDWSRSGDALAAKGMFDPLLGPLLAADYLPAEFASKAQWQFAPYRSALPGALVAEKRELWAVPADVSLFQSDGWVAEGRASLAWVQQMRALNLGGMLAPSVDRVEVNPDEVQRWIDERMVTGVSARLEGEVLMLVGDVSYAGEAVLSARLQRWHREQLLLFSEVNAEALNREVDGQAKRLSTNIQQQKLAFASGVVMSPQGWAAMEQLADDLNEWLRVVPSAEEAVLVLYHHEEGLSKRRATKVKELLQQRGVPESLIRLAVQKQNDNAGMAVVTLKFTYGALKAFDIRL